MTTSTLSQQKVVSREEWLATRKALLAKEKAMFREFDELRVERRKLPWGKIEKLGTFEGPQGQCTLAELFRTAANSPSITTC